MRLGPVKRLTGGLDVDERVTRQYDLDLRRPARSSEPIAPRSFESRTLRLGCWSGDASFP